MSNTTHATTALVALRPLFPKLKNGNGTKGRDYIPKMFIKEQKEQSSDKKVQMKSTQANAQPYSYVKN
jgi:hypothetical protein